MPKIHLGHRILILRLTLLLALLAVAVADPIPQDPSYHHFADTRVFLGIANFADTVSNAAFTLVGLCGLGWLLVAVGRGHFTASSEAWPYMVFSVGLVLLGPGSAYYHLEPTTERLFWDRLVMTFCFMGLFAGVLNDRVDLGRYRRWVLPTLVIIGVLSVIYWVWTETQGRGDLRLYILVQFYPIAALPLILWLFPVARYTKGSYLAWVIFWYALAKGCEHYDAQIFAFFGEWIGGHALKHLAATVAALCVLRMIMVNSRTTPQDLAREESRCK